MPEVVAPASLAAALAIAPVGCWTESSFLPLPPVSSSWSNACRTTWMDHSAT